MVTYSEFISVGHEAYQELGGTYDEDTAAELVEILARFWQRNREELTTIGKREAKRIVKKNLNV